MVIACHYDSKLEPRGGVFASDSAVPCAMMLNLAKTMREELRVQKKNNQDLTIQFLFFDGEEAFKRWTSTDSIYGSRRLASDATPPAEWRPSSLLSFLPDPSREGEEGRLLLVTQ